VASCEGHRHSRDFAIRCFDIAETNDRGQDVTRRLALEEGRLQFVIHRFLARQDEETRETNGISR